MATVDASFDAQRRNGGAFFVAVTPCVALALHWRCVCKGLAHAACRFLPDTATRTEYDHAYRIATGPAEPNTTHSTPSAAMPTSKVRPARPVLPGVTAPGSTTASAAKAVVNKPGAAKAKTPGAESPSDLIDAKIEELGGWRGEMLSRLRALIKEAEPEVAEEWKWRGTPVWSHNGLICTGETYKNVVKTTLAKGASLPAPSGLFNSSLEGNTRRAIDFHEGDPLDEAALKAMVRAAVALNGSSARGRSTRSGPRPRAKTQS